MATYYIDPVGGSNSNDGLTESAPKLTVPTITSDNAYLLKRGTTYTASIAIPTTATGVRIGAYGSGALPIVNPGASGRWGVRVANGATGTIVEDLELTGAAGNGSQTTFGVHWGTGGAADAHDGTLRRCVIHAPVGNASGDCNGVQWFGNNAVIEDCTIYDCPDDGLWLIGTAPIIRRNRISTVGQDASATGDCIQLSGAVGAAQILDNYLDHSNGLEKQCFIVSGASAGSGGVFSGNTCIFPSDPDNSGNSCIYSDQPGFVIKNNRTYGGTYGVLIDAGAGQQVTGNLIVGAYIGINTTNSAAGLLCDNNTFVDCLSFGAYMPSADATSYVRNNVFLRCVRGLATHGSINKAKNCYYGNSEYNWASIAGGGTIEGDAVIADPLLSPSYRPLPGSPLIGAGIHLGYTRDLSGVRRPNPPSIGAYDVAKMRTFA